jgi:hypothetical protein
MEGVWGVDSNDVWFVANNNQTGSEVYHYHDGKFDFYQFWKDSTLLGHKLGNSLRGIWASPDARWVYAVGNAGRVLRLDRSTGSWTDTVLPVPSLRDVTGFGTEAYTLGEDLDANWFLFHFDGTRWSMLDSSTGPPDSSKPWRISGQPYEALGFLPPDTLYVGGPRIWKWSHGKWIWFAPRPGGTATYYYTNGIYAGGWNRIFAGADHGHLYFWDGEIWHFVPTRTYYDRVERVFEICGNAYLVGWGDNRGGFTHLRLLK